MAKFYVICHNTYAELQITKQIVKLNSEAVFTAALTVTNEFGEICVLAFVATKSHAQFESALLKMQESLEKYGHSQPKVFYTDNPAADKNFLEGIFPSLTEDVIPVQKYPTLKPFVCPADVDVSVQSSASGIESALAKITDDLDVADENSCLAVGFDAEWNVDLVRGGGPQPTAIIQIAYRKWVYVFQVYYLYYLMVHCHSITYSRSVTSMGNFQQLFVPFFLIHKFSKLGETSLRI